MAENIPWVKQIKLISPLHDLKVTMESNRENGHLRLPSCSLESRIA